MNISTDSPGKLFCLAAICIVLGVLCTSVSATEYVGTVVLASGQKYDQVSFTIDRAQEQVTIDLDPMNLIVAFKDIAHVFDREGNEVTQQWLDPDANKWRTSKEKFWAGGMIITGGYTALGGPSYELFRDGWNSNLSLLRSLTRRVGLRARLSLASVTSRYPFGNNVTLIDKLVVTRLSLAVQADLRADRPKTGSMFYFIYGGIGTVVHDGSAPRFCNCLGIEVHQMIADNLTITLGVNADVVYGPEPVDVKVTDVLLKRNYAYILDVTVGIALLN